MPRLLFEKTGRSVWISHLDLMRLFQRAFKRAGLALTHTQGFNPRPSVSIALPLSVGVESRCELLDFDLEGDDIPANDEIMNRLNQALTEGVSVKEVYSTGRKLRDLAYLHCRVNLVYDQGVPINGCSAVTELFSREEVIVSKRTKSGMQDQSIIPMIRRLTVTQESENVLLLDAVICCQNPTLNPAQLTAAIELYLPSCKPDFHKCTRLEILDQEEKIFR